MAMFYSHDQVTQPGYITRLMACDHPEGYGALGTACYSHHVQRSLRRTAKRSIYVKDV